MQSFCVMDFGSALAAAALPLSVIAQLRAPPRNAVNSVRGENHVPAMLVAVSFFGAYTLREEMFSGKYAPSLLNRSFPSMDLSGVLRLGLPATVTTSPTATESFVKPSGLRTDAAPASTSISEVEPFGFFTCTIM